jgi:type II secretory pathway pseudopilin PulG
VIPTFSHRPSPRAFTLLEVVLAAMVGLLMVLGAFAALSGMEGANRRLGTRAAERAQLDRAQLVLYRALSALAMSDTPAPPGRWRDRQPAGAGTPPPAASGSEEGSSRGAGESAARPEPPPRFVLAVDESAGRPPPTWNAGSPPQHLELTVTHPPILPEEDDQEAFRPPMTNHQGLALDVQALRGRFELVPVPGRDGSTEYELWWRPLPPRPVGQDRLVTSNFAERPVLVAEKLRWAWFEVFAARRRHADGFSATWVVDLPAYVRFEAMTASGLYVDWLFEPGWTSVPEYTLRSPTPDERAPATGDGASNVSATGANQRSPAPLASAPARRDRAVRRDAARPASASRVRAEADPVPRGPAGPPPSVEPPSPNLPDEPVRPVPKPGPGRPTRYTKPTTGTY